MPIVQKKLLRIAGRLARPSITATQMLDSMVGLLAPDARRGADVANAILDGTDAVMLSQETAIGQYPVESVAMMVAVAERTESVVPYSRKEREAECTRERAGPVLQGVAYSACLVAGTTCEPRGAGDSDVVRAARRDWARPTGQRPDLRAPRRGGGDGSSLQKVVKAGVQAASMRRHEVTEAPNNDAGRRVVELGWVPAARGGRDHRGAAQRESGHHSDAPDPGP